MTLAERFWSKINKRGPLPSAQAIAAHPEIAGKRCWLWTGGQVPKGYGMCWMDTNNVGAHIVAWYLSHGAWPTLFTLHKCDTRLCVRDEHLFEGAAKDNNRDCKIKGRTLTGESNSQAKLTAKKVRQIRKLSSQKSHRWLGRKFGVSHRTVGNILRGTVWQHVK